MVSWLALAFSKKDDSKIGGKTNGLKGWMLTKRNVSGGLSRICLFFLRMESGGGGVFLMASRNFFLRLSNCWLVWAFETLAASRQMVKMKNCFIPPYDMGNFIKVN